MKTKQNQNWKLYGKLWLFLVVIGKALGESEFNRVYFTIFRAKVWKIFIYFWVDFVAGNFILKALFT